MDPNVQCVIDQHRKRAEAGLNKYGVDTERTGLSLGQWLQHAQDELMDGAVYIERLKRDMLAIDQLVQQISGVAMSKEGVGMHRVQELCCRIQSILRGYPKQIDERVKEPELRGLDKAMKDFRDATSAVPIGPNVPRPPSGPIIDKMRGDDQPACPQLVETKTAPPILERIAALEQFARRRDEATYMHGLLMETVKNLTTRMNAMEKSFFGA